MERFFFSHLSPHPGFSEGVLAVSGDQGIGNGELWPLDEFKLELLARRAEKDRASQSIRGSRVLRRKQGTVQTAGHRSNVKSHVRIY